MSVNIYDSTNDKLNQIAGREDVSFWEGTQAQWNALSSADKALWTGKYVIITDAEESVNKYNGTELINIAGKGQTVKDTKDCITTFTSSDDSTESGLILPSGGDITVPQIVSGDTHGNLFSGLSKIALNTRKLINTVKRIWNSVGATWVSGHAYAVNAMVVYENGHVYKCKAAHTSSSSILPTDTTYWTDTTLANEIASLNSNYAKEKPRLLHSINSANNTWTYIFEQCLTWITLNVDTMLIPRVFVVLDGRIYRINAYYQNNMLGLSEVFNYVGSFALLACSCSYNTQTKKVTNSAFFGISSSANIVTESFDAHRYTGEVYIYI